jgi:hypothetical protein
VFYAKLSAFGIEDIKRNGFETTGVENRGTEGRVSDNCGVLGDVTGMSLGIYVPKNLRIQSYFPSAGICPEPVSSSSGIFLFLSVSVIWMEMEDFA